MRAVELAKVAAAAEALRVKRYARRQGIRLGFAAGALLFALALFILIHALAVVLLMALVRSWLAILIVLAADLVIAGVLASMALSNKPDQIEQEAAAVRRQSLAEAKKSATSLATVAEVAGFAMARRGRRQVARSRAGKAWMIADLASRFIRRR